MSHIEDLVAAGRRIELTRRVTDMALPWRKAAVAGLGGGLGIAVMSWLCQATGQPLFAVPFATSIVLVMSAPDSLQAQPRNIVGGHLLSAISGFIALWLLGSAPWAAAPAVGLGVALMVLTHTLHPPASINGVLIVMLAPPLTYLASPVLAGALILAGFAWAYHRATGQAWPRSGGDTGNRAAR
jgi:CBS-domain-containing membrane protein